MSNEHNKVVHAQLPTFLNPPEPESLVEVLEAKSETTTAHGMKKRKKKKEILILTRLTFDVTASIRDPAGGCSGPAADCRRFVWELLHSWACGSDLRPAMTQGLVARWILRRAAREVFIGVCGTVREWPGLSNKAALGLNWAVK